MSSKQASKPNPRVAKQEAIVTRHKSAQMKRQLRVKDRSMKHITDLLKSPTKDTAKAQPKTKSPPKLKQSLLQSIEKVQKLPEKVFRLSKVLRKKVALAREEEFYPNRRKRKVEVNRVVLKPTHDLKLVGGITGSVKRKSSVPHKATKPSPKDSPVYGELSMAEVIRLMEDDLTDEDMMEILTCPSPVWWEDPPDDEHIEDAIFTRSPCPKPPEPKEKSPDNMDVDDILEVDDVTDKPIEITNIKAKSDKFLKKRSKLEGVLGHIKNKSNIKIRQNDKNTFSEDVVVMCSGYRKNEDIGNLKGKESDAKVVSRLSESDGDELFTDSSMNVDEFLNDLENMDIPVESERKSDVIVIEDDVDFLKGNDKQTEVRKRPKKETIKMKTNSDETLRMLKNVSVLKKYRLDRFASPKSFDSSSSKSGDSQDMDTISDTNIKFLCEEELEQDRNAINDEMRNKKDSNKNQTFEIKKQGHANESMPVEDVYGTKGADGIHEISKKVSDDDEDGDPCEKCNQKAGTIEIDKTDVNKNDSTNTIASGVTESDTYMVCDACKPQTKKVSDDKNVKYCLKCSCIFDSKECTYCLEKCKTNFTNCVPCRIKFCCETYYKVHALSHTEGLKT